MDAARHPKFRVLATDGAARRGQLRLAHGLVETPAFMPVGTYGAVKGVSGDLLEQLGASIILGNTYHLWIRPGVERIARLGGLHRFCGWDRNLLTDSGGFQVMSLATRRKTSEEGVRFRDHLDGTERLLTPETCMAVQAAFGVDIAMVLDECLALPAEPAELSAALERTTRWARRCRDSWSGSGDLFGIIQGGTDMELRRRSAAAIVGIGFDGYAIGGLAVGEAPSEMHRVASETAALLPAASPRYLMGVGRPQDLLAAVAGGVDLFDCVLPTRNARNGMLFTSQGLVRIKRQEHADAEQPLDPACSCPTCRRHSRAYLRHLFVLGDLTAPMLLSIHNVAFYLDFARQIREAIASASLAEFARSWSDFYPD